MAVLRVVGCSTFVERETKPYTCYPLSPNDVTRLVTYLLHTVITPAPLSTVMKQSDSPRPDTRECPPLSN